MKIVSCLLTIVVSVAIPCKAMERTAAPLTESIFHSVIQSKAWEQLPEHPPLPSGIKVLQGDLCFLRQLRADDVNALCSLITATSGSRPVQEDLLRFIAQIQAYSCAIFVNTDKRNTLEGIIIIDLMKGILLCIIHPHFFVKAAFSEAMQLIMHIMREQNPNLDALTATVEMHDQSTHPAVYERLGFQWIARHQTGRLYYDQDTSYPIEQTVFSYQYQEDSWQLI